MSLSPATVEKPQASDDYPAVGVVHQMLEAAFRKRAANKEVYGWFRKIQTEPTFVREHCTLKMAFPRQYGNTVAAAHASKMLGIRKNIEGSGLVVVPYEAQGKIIEHYGAENVLSIGQVKNRLKKEELGLVTSIVVDGATYIQSLGAIGILEDLLDLNKGGWLVLIG